jgi:hypothetical protein
MRGVPRERRGAVERGRRLQRDPEDARGAGEDQHQLLGRVEVEPGDEAEAVAQRAGDQAGTGRGAHEREPRQVEADRAGRRALADHDVELEVLHRRVEHLFDRARQPVDLVDEEHVAVVEIGEDRGEIAGALQRGATRDPQAHAHLHRDDAGETGLAQPGRAREQDVVDGLPALLRRAQHDLQVLDQARLADEVVERPRPERGLLGRLDRVGTGAQQLLAAHTRTASCFSASRSRSSTPPSSGSCASTSRISSGA